MKTFALQSLISIATSGLIANASAQTCTASMQNVTANAGYSDSSTLAEIKLDKDATPEVCCGDCTANPACVAWTYQEKGLLSHPKCYLHAERNLPKEDDDKRTCGVTKPPPPTPPPAPTPPPPPGSVTNWVVIAAGSSTFQNYRHQSDACHAKQVALANGVPEENIILMMQDDVATARQNPFPVRGCREPPRALQLCCCEPPLLALPPASALTRRAPPPLPPAPQGKMFNKPTAAGTPGVDVYAGCKPDYTGKVVTAKLFLDVLQGNADKVPAGGKVLKSGPTDKVFVNFADHGGAGIVEFPNGPYLHAADLNAALKVMHTKTMYDKLVFYMEACNGGSMFANQLPTDINVYATTAASPSEPSWGTYCPPQDKVNGKAIGSCLGDLYSVNWMEDSDTAAGQARTLDGQYEFVRNETKVKSHVTEYGTVGTWDTQDTVHEFQGHSGSSNPAAAAVVAAAAALPAVPKDAVDSRDIELVTRFYAYLRAENAQEKTVGAAALLKVVEARERADVVWPAVIAELGEGAATVAQADEALHQCHKAVYGSVEKHCGRFDSYGLKYSHGLVGFCETRTASEIEAVITKHC